MASSPKIKSKRYDGVYYNPLQNGDKTFYISYKELSGKKIWLKIGKESDGIRENYCYNKRAEIINQIRLGEIPTIVKNRRIKKEAITFDEIAQYYLDYKHNKIASGSYIDMKSKYTNHIKPHLGNKLVEEITVDDIEAISEEKYELLSPKTVNMITELIGTIYNFAIKQKKFKGENPAKDAHKYAIDNERERFLSKDEIKILLGKIKNDKQAYLFTILALSTGGRIQTICDIQKKNINIDTKSIYLKNFKSKKTYTGYIKKEFSTYIKNQINNFEPNDYVLGDGEDLVKQVQRKLRPILNELFNDKLEQNDRKNRVVIHTLRHTFASQLIANNVPIFVVQKLMDHSDIKTTMRYVNVDSYFGQDFVDNLF